MKLKKFLSMAVASALAFSLVACGGEAGNESANTGSDRIILGTMGPLTGENAIYGITTLNGISLAIEEKETVLGKPVELLSVDDKADQTEAVKAYNKFVNNDKVVAIVGATTSGASLSVAVTSVKDNTPILTPTGTVPEITTSGENVFRACYTDPKQGEIMAKFAYESLGLRKVAIIENTDSSYSAGLTASFTRRFVELGGEIISNEGYTGADKDFKAQLTKIASTNPEALFIPDYYTQAYLIASQAESAGLKDVVLLGGDGWDGMHTIFKEYENGEINESSILENAYFCSHYSMDDTEPQVQSFVEAYRAKYGEDPTAFAALGYDGANIMMNAIETAGSTDSQAIIDAIKNTQYKGVTGDITFDENGDPIKEVTILKIEGGKYKLFEKIAE
ncbi:MAG: ABC transporter substrate-binding protein [Eubacteriales bacterium]|nr:ABC transporter substrate-binding protein [Eubacteriales bacterium]